MAIDATFDAFLRGLQDRATKLDTVMRDGGTSMQSKGYFVGIFLSEIKNSINEARK